LWFKEDQRQPETEDAQSHQVTKLALRGYPEFWSGSRLLRPAIDLNKGRGKEKKKRMRRGNERLIREPCKNLIERQGRNSGKGSSAESKKKWGFRKKLINPLEDPLYAKRNMKTRRGKEGKKSHEKCLWMCGKGESDTHADSAQKTRKERR